jgi:hypothetical protein
MAYTSITVEGGIFPADLLDQIAAGDAEGQAAKDFGLDGSRRLPDAIQGAFSDARAYWDAFQRRLARSKESSTTLTREDWMAPFLELLGFEDLVLQRSSVQVGTDSYVISHRAGQDPYSPPVHIVAVDEALDRRNGSRRSPHAVVQEYLNRSDAVWGIVTNGERLRLLRDTARLAKPTYLEFDLQGMITGNVYSEFVLLYRLLHASRFPRDSAGVQDSWLEKYYNQGIEQGGRVREHLRDGVEEALKEIGTAFLSHPDSGALRARFENKSLTEKDYYRQLLRLVYRFLFLMVAEERRLIFPQSEAGTALQTVYTRYYGIGRLRDRAERYFAGDSYCDLWLGLRETFRLLRDNDAAKKLGLAALNGELFGSGACADLESACCTNEELLRVVRHLSTFKDGNQRRRVNYAALDVEEFGSVYESLLDFHPQVTLDPPEFALVTGSERKQTGSYYTPPELVRELIESALVPVIEERLQGKRTKEEKEEALLGMRVCDPASGSGHFLLAAARRIARELARARSGEDEPAPEEYRHALRDVIRHCIYAVDKNPLAVDLCKVALWVEGHNAGRPLSFLDNHIKCGDSLVGVADLSVLEKGISDDAYKPVTGDDKEAAKYYRNRNKREREGQFSLPVGAAPGGEGREALAHEFDALAAQEERTPGDVLAKEELYDSLRGQGTAWWNLKVACDLWTYSFFAPLRHAGGDHRDHVPTTSDVRGYLLRPNAANGALVGETVGFSQQMPFFHWPLEFPEVVERGGFDVVLGNPPFLGGKRISTRLGDEYRTCLKVLYQPMGNTTDLCALFLRRAHLLLRHGGHLGMVATNSIGQGDTRESGLAVIIELRGNITLAHRFIKWPGTANVEVNLLAIRKGPWEGTRRLDGEDVSIISSRLENELEQVPERLTQNDGKAFIGSYVRGIGFILSLDQAERLMTQDARNRECLFPYLNGQDLNSRPDQSPSRWAINFLDWPRERAEAYPELFRIVETQVLPERLKIREEKSRQKNVTSFWRYDALGKELYQAITPLPRVLVRARIAEMHALVFVPTGWVYNEKTVVFAFDDDYHFALLQCNAHELWMRQFTSTLRTDINYAPTDCFDTFPFAEEPALEHQKWATRVGAEYHEHRHQTMLSRNLGLTKTYNLFHKPECEDADIVRMRKLHAEMDGAILACYGWQDIDPGHRFYQNERGHTRYTISPDARREVLRRLLELNLRIAAEEEASGIGRRR